MELSVKLVQEAQTGTSVPFMSYCLTASFTQGCEFALWFFKVQYTKLQGYSEQE